MKLLTLTVCCMAGMRIFAQFMAYLTLSVHPDFEHYKMEFTTLTHVNVGHISIEYKVLPEPKLAEYHWNRYVIYVDPLKWETLSYIERKALMFHELTHSIGMIWHDVEIRPHDRTLCSKNIMFPVHDGYCLERDWNTYYEKDTKELVYALRPIFFMIQ